MIATGRTKTALSREQVAYLAARAQIETINDEVLRRCHEAGFDDRDASDERLDFEERVEISSVSPQRRIGNRRPGTRSSLGTSEP